MNGVGNFWASSYSFPAFMLQSPRVSSRVPRNTQGSLYLSRWVSQPEAALAVRPGTLLEKSLPHVSSVTPAGSCSIPCQHLPRL